MYYFSVKPEVTLNINISPTREEKKDKTLYFRTVTNYLIKRDEAVSYLSVSEG